MTLDEFDANKIAFDSALRSLIFLHCPDGIREASPAQLSRLIDSLHTSLNVALSSVLVEKLTETKKSSAPPICNHCGLMHHKHQFCPARIGQRD